MTSANLAAILTEAERNRRVDRARAAQVTTTAQAASGDSTVGQTSGAAVGTSPGMLVALDANGKIPRDLLYPVSSTSTARTYEHVQTVAATAWVIAHNLQGYPPVVLFDPVTRQSAIADVHYPDENHVLVKFGRPKTGVCRLSL